jgi:hypothetical protein
MAQIFYFVMFTPTLGPIQLPIRRKFGAPSQEVNWLEHEADDSLPFSAEV